MRDPLPITPVQRAVSGVPRLPGSKSITNRALVLAAMATGTSKLEGACISEDTLLMVEALHSLGLRVVANHADQTMEVEGCAGRIPADHADIHVGNAGTVARFLTATLCIGHGSYRLDGTDRMRERPIGPLAEALQSLGAKVTYLDAAGCLPIRIVASGLPGGFVRISAAESSQFLSALLLAAPFARKPTVLATETDVPSRPYVDMTVRMMQTWSLAVQMREDATGIEFAVPAPQTLTARSYRIEPDASAASYVMAAAALTGGTVRIPGLGRQSLQGDVQFADVLRAMGAEVVMDDEAVTVHGGAPLRGVDVDMNGISDTVMTLAALAPFASSPTRIRNVAHIRLKECDRIEAMATELRRLRVEVRTHDDGLTIYPARPRGAVVDTYDDHRMAMSLSLIGLRVPGVAIRNPSCTAKTFPGYFDELERLCAEG